MLSESTSKLIAGILLAIGLAFKLGGLQQKKYTHVVFAKVIGDFLGAVHYIFLGGYTGMALNFASCVANTTYWYRVQQNKSRLPFQILFSIMFIVLGILSWHGPVCIVIIFAKVLSTVAMSINSPRTIRLLHLVIHPCWIAYNIVTGSFVGILADSAMILSALIGIIRLDIPWKKWFSGKK